MPLSEWLDLLDLSFLQQKRRFGVRTVLGFLRPLESWAVFAVSAKGSLASEDEVPPSFILSRAYLLVVCWFRAYKFLSADFRNCNVNRDSSELRNLSS